MEEKVCYSNALVSNTQRLCEIEIIHGFSCCPSLK